MTREQTIEKLKALYTNAVAAMLRADACDDDESSKVMTEYAETLNAAINALETALQTDGDCISRRDAIRIASGYCHPANVAQELAKLPSTQPDNSCDGCKYEDADDGVLVPCGFCKRSHSDNYERRTDEDD